MVDSQEKVLKCICQIKTETLTEPGMVKRETGEEIPKGRDRIRCGENIPTS